MPVKQNLIETRNWVIEFGLDYELPAWLQSAVDQDCADDTSWHHDVSPSIAFRETSTDGKQIVVFVDHADKLLRETPFRFSFFYRDEADELTDAYFCESERDAKNFLKKKLSKTRFE